MILTDQEMDHLRQHLEMQAGLDEELLERCGELIHTGKFDEAVRSAFVLLEERLRALVNQDKLTGVKLAETAFDPDKGLLSKHLGQTKQERLGLCNIFTGAFRLFRNPIAHNFIDYEADEGRAIIYFVSLLLSILDKAAERLPPHYFPEQLEEILSRIDDKAGQKFSGQLRQFFSRCMKIGIRPTLGKRFSWIPFRSYALQERPYWPEPRKHYIAMFYLVTEDVQNPAINFPVSTYYSSVVGLDIERVGKELLALGLLPTRKHRDYHLYLKEKRATDFFNDLYSLVEKIEERFEATLS